MATNKHTKVHKIHPIDLKRSSKESARIEPGFAEPGISVGHYVYLARPSTHVMFSARKTLSQGRGH